MNSDTAKKIGYFWGLLLYQVQEVKEEESQWKVLGYMEL